MKQFLTELADLIEKHGVALSTHECGCQVNYRIEAKIGATEVDIEPYSTPAEIRELAKYP